MRSRPRGRWIAALLAVVAALVSASTASADVTVDVQHYPWELGVAGCTETVIASGTLTVVMQSTTDAAGLFSHQLSVLIFKGTGYGVDSGEPYRVSLESETVLKPPGNGATVATMQGAFKVIPLGDGEKRVGTAPFHITFNALGEVTSLKDENNIVCH